MASGSNQPAREWRFGLLCLRILCCKTDRIRLHASGKGGASATLFMVPPEKWLVELNSLHDIHQGVQLWPLNISGCSFFGLAESLLSLKMHLLPFCMYILDTT